MSSDPTSGAEIASSGGAALAFAAIGALWTLVLQRVLPDPFRRPWAKRWSWGLLGLVAIAGGIAVLVGISLWATGTEIGP